MNVLKHHGIISGQMGRTGRDTDTFIGNSDHTILATNGGFVELLVKLKDKVKVGQKVAIQRMRLAKSWPNIGAGRPARSWVVAQTQPPSLAFR